MRIGTDITVVSRIENSLKKFENKFLDRFLTKEEQEKLSSRIESIAGYWAAKEAVAKALGCGICADLGFHDIIIYKDEKGATHFRLSEKAKAIHKMKSSSLSIAHDGGFAIAIAIVTQIEV
jgi:holo-[acyl-carrier protein] synthase